MHSLVSMHVTYGHTHIRKLHSICICPRACEHDDAEDGPRRRGNGTQMLELFTLNLRDDVREANTRGKMQNAECKTRTVRWTRPEKARWKLGPSGSKRGREFEWIRRPAVRGRFDRLEIRTSLCNLSNCSLCYFPLSFGLDVRSKLPPR